MTNTLAAILLPTVILYLLAIVNIIDSRVRDQPNKSRSKFDIYLNLRDIILAVIVVDLTEVLRRFSIVELSSTSIIGVILFFFHFSLFIVISLRKRNDNDKLYNTLSMNRVMQLYFAVILLFTNAYTINRIINIL